MQTYSLPTLTSMLPGARAPAQRRHTFALHTPRFASLAPLRANIKTRLHTWGVDNAYVDMVQLSICEAITNLIKHPDTKADLVHIALFTTNGYMTVDIADNGSPFASFDAECNAARRCSTAADSLAEGGYGLHFILTQHQSVIYVRADNSPDGFNHLILHGKMPEQSANNVESYIKNDAQNDTQVEKLSSSHARRKIFIVDNDPLTQQFYHPVLSQYYDISFFRHAADALARFTTERPVLVISDLRLSGMDGLTLRRHLTKLEGGDVTPFVFLSSNASIAHEPYVTQAGIDDYLCKPVSPTRLLAVASRVIERASCFTAALQGRINAQITSLLTPHLPARYKGWQIETRSAVVEAGGGDFTIYRSQPDFFMATLADVMGHGLHAKFFAYAYAGYLRSLIHLNSNSLCPADFLTQISSAVNADSFLDSTIMTCLAFSLDEKNVITFASAGHPPPWKVCLDAPAETVDIAGPLAGLLGESRYSQQSVNLQTSERIIIATDGFWDCWDNQHTLRTDLQTSVDRPIQEYTDSLWRLAHERADARQKYKDDATLIIIEAGEIQ